MSSEAPGSGKGSNSCSEKNAWAFLETLCRTYCQNNNRSRLKGKLDFGFYSLYDVAVIAESTLNLQKSRLLMVMNGTMSLHLYICLWD